MSDDEALEPQEQRKGCWSHEEHQLFLEALRKYGKDWRAIQFHVKTRADTNVRAHAQKFLRRQRRIIRDYKQFEPQEVEEARFYANILSSKMHKKYSRQLLAKKKLADVEEQRQSESLPRKPINVEKQASSSYLFEE